jgi:hypothetical protein
MVKVIFKLLWGLLGAAFFTGTARYWGWDVAVSRLWGSIGASSQLNAISLMIGGLGGMALLLCSLVFRWDDKLYNLIGKRYEPAKLEQLRKAVKAVQIEWTKFPAGLDEDERNRWLRELVTTIDDFSSDPLFGSTLLEIRSRAMLMNVIGSRRYRESFGETKQYEKLLEMDLKLQQACSDFLEQTKSLVIYQR